MSTEVESRVVEMKFENKQFEKNMSTTLSSLEKLKEKLKFKNSTKGFEEIAKTCDKVDFSKIENATNTISSKFSALEVVGVTALANITNSAVNTGKHIIKALTTDPVLTGFDEYETKIGSIQTIMSNTASKGTTMEDVTKVIGELNTYADKTIYNFAEMTRNIGTFTAAGIGLEESAKDIQGIANLAAASGSTSQQASTAMYQLSQAMSAGVVKLMDWNSVVNAGMGGEKFQEALKATARDHGIAVDDMIKKNGSFRESLQEGWITADIMSETLQKFTVEGAKKYANQMVESGKWTKKQRKELIAEAKSMEDAATKVKTYTQLWDTLQESVQSGWSQTWEILIGNFEESKEMFTGVSDALGDIINASANSRNELLQGWKDLGGRDSVIAGVANIFESVMNIANSVKEAFRDVFPRVTSKQLYNFTKGFENLTEKFKIGKESAENIKKVFIGLFSIIDLGMDIIKLPIVFIDSLIDRMTGVTKSVTVVGDVLGDFGKNISNSVDNITIFDNVFNEVPNMVKSATDKIHNFAVAIKKFFSDINIDLSFITDMGKIDVDKIGSKFENIGNKFKNITNKIDFDIIKERMTNGIKTVMNSVKKIDWFSVIRSFYEASAALTFNTIRKQLPKLTKGAVEVMESVSGVLDGVKETFKAYQSELKASALMKIAAAIAILSLSIIALSFIDGDKIGGALGAMTGAMLSLFGCMFLFTKFSGDIKNTAKLCLTMITLGLAINSLASAMKKVSTIEDEKLLKSVLTIGVVMAEMVGFSKMAGTNTKGLVLVSGAMTLFVAAVKGFGLLKINTIIKGLSSIGIVLGEIAVTSRIMPKNMPAIGFGLNLIATSMLIMCKAISKLGSIKMEIVGKGLLAMAGILITVSLACNIANKTISGAVSISMIAATLLGLCAALNAFGSMKLSDITKGLLSITVVLLSVSFALKAMTGTISGSAALTIASIALGMFVPIIMILGNLKWSTVAKGLITIAGCMTIVAVSGLLLTPVIPVILSLSKAFVKFGIASLAVGVSIALIGVGLTALGVGLVIFSTNAAAAAGALVGAIYILLKGILEIIPNIQQEIYEVISAVCSTIMTCVPILTETVLAFIVEMLIQMKKYYPIIIESLCNLIITVIDGLADKSPEIVASLCKLFNNIFSTLFECFKQSDPTVVLTALATMSGIMLIVAALHAITPMIPLAMLGLVGIGAMIAETALILAAIGQLTRIPGLSEYMNHGTDILASIGTGIGKFIGSIGKEITTSMSSTLPALGSDLSSFMANAKGFIDGASCINSDLLNGILNLTGAVLALTAADLLESISSWITGDKNTLSTFSEQLVPFAENLKLFADSVVGIDVNSFTSASLAVSALADLAKNLPNSGGLKGLWSGNNDADEFGKQILVLGSCIKQYSDAVQGVDAVVIQNSANALGSIVDVSKKIPNSGGLKGLWSGNNDADEFGKQILVLGSCIKQYSDAVQGVDAVVINTSMVALTGIITSLGNLPTNMDATTEHTISNFGIYLTSIATSISEYIKLTSGLNIENINSLSEAIPMMVNALSSIGNIDVEQVSKFSQGICALSGINLRQMFTDADVNKNIDLIYNMMNTIYDIVRDMTGEMSRAGEKMMDSIYSGMNSKIDNCGYVVGNFCQDGIAMFEFYHEQFVEAGLNTIDGFIGGMKHKEYEVLNTIKSIMSGAVIAARDTLDIHSPSRVFYGIGNNTYEGYINSLNDGEHKVYRAGKNLAMSAFSSMSTVMSMIDDIEWSNTPTITPLVDTSNIDSLDERLNRIFNNPVATTEANLKGIRNIRTNNDQNGTEVVDAIDRLSSKLDNIPRGNSTTINGITYDDGSNIVNAVETLVRGVRMERRM